ncbi:MAG: NAD(P)-dependent oxidoreductase [Sciscionella sp.]
MIDGGAARTVAVLGTGIMGLPMAKNLHYAGFDTRVWNRTASKAHPAVDSGATLAGTPAEAARGADYVLTMLADGPTVHSVMSGPDGALGAMRSDALWLQMSTVGIQHTERLASLAAEVGVTFVDAPVLGTKQPAESGQLVVLESGPSEVSERCHPVFEAVGGRTLRVGAAGSGTRLKLVTNNWVLAVTNATAECIALAKALDINPRQFLESISGGALDLPYAHLKGGAMIKGEYPLSFPLSLAAKDARLVLEAAGGGVDLSGTRATLSHLERAEQAGRGDEDMAAMYYGVTDQ